MKKIFYNFYLNSRLIIINYLSAYLVTRFFTIITKLLQVKNLF